MPLVTDARAYAQSAGAFAVDGMGRRLPMQANMVLALDKMGAAVSYSLSSSSTMVTGLDGFGPALCDDALTRMRLDAQRRFRLTVPKDYWNDAALDHARRNGFHSVKDCQAELQWDGVERLHKRLIRDPWEEMLVRRLDGREGKVRTADLQGLLCMGDPARRTQDRNNRLGAVIRRLGWAWARVRWDGEREHRYVKGDGATDALPPVESAHVVGPRL